MNVAIPAAQRTYATIPAMRVRLPVASTRTKVSTQPCNEDGSPGRGPSPVRIASGQIGASILGSRLDFTSTHARQGAALLPEGVGQEQPAVGGADCRSLSDFRGGRSFFTTHRAAADISAGAAAMEVPPAWTAGRCAWPAAEDLAGT